MKHTMYETTQQFFDHTNLMLSSSGIPSTTTFKPGKTLMTMQGATQARIMNTGGDPFGQWVYQTFECKNHHKLTIIMAYQPCQHDHTQNSNICTLTVHAQQMSLLQQQGRQCTPQQAFIADLRLFLQDIKSSTHHILLLGNFSETLNTATSSITKSAMNLGC